MGHPMMGVGRFDDGNGSGSCALDVAPLIGTFMIKASAHTFNSMALARRTTSFCVSDSFMEMAEFDMPAIIDSILSLTGFKNLHYLGHSRGTTILFALLATKPEYNEKVGQFRDFKHSIALTKKIYSRLKCSSLYT